MSKTIKIDLSPESVTAALKLIQNYQKSFPAREAEFLRRLSGVAERAASMAYGEAITVSTVARDNGFEIHANGRAVMFLEFGAGIYTDTNHPMAPNSPVDIQPGSWSVQDKQQFYTWGYWYFNNIKMYGVEPREGLFNAEMAIKQDVYKIAKEVFGT